MYYALIEEAWGAPSIEQRPKPKPKPQQPKKFTPMLDDSWETPYASAPPASPEPRSMAKAMETLYRTKGFESFLQTLPEGFLNQAREYFTSQVSGSPNPITIEVTIPSLLTIAMYALIFFVFYDVISRYWK
jgi:hypothetical protein